MMIGKIHASSRDKTMKRCSQCHYENSDQMSFCLECGTPLAAAPLVFNLHDSETPSRSGAPATNLNRSAETVFGASPLPPTLSLPNASPKKSNGKIWLALGGVFALLGLMITAGALIVYFNWKSKTRIAVSPTPPPAPTREAGKSPSPKSSVSPSVSPSPVGSATPQVSFTPPTEPTKRGTFTVYANGGWQVSELDTVPLENFKTSASGLIDLAGIKTGVSTSGVTDAKTKSRRIYAEYPTGALMMRTRYADGKYSNVQPVTAAPSLGTWQNFPEERGRLEFCVNDNAPEGNGGHFTVTKTSTSVPKKK